MISSFQTLLLGTLSLFSKSLVKDTLKGAGLGLISATVMLVAYNMLMSYLRSAFGTLGEFFYAFNLAGIDDFLGIVTGCIQFKIYLNSKKISLRSIK